MADAQFRIDEGKKRFLDEAAIKANEHCGGCVKRLNDDHGRPLLMVDVAMARKGLVCRVTEGLTYLAWLLVGMCGGVEPVVKRLHLPHPCVRACRCPGHRYCTVRHHLASIAYVACCSSWLCSIWMLSAVAAQSGGRARHR